MAQLTPTVSAGRALMAAGTVRVFDDAGDRKSSGVFAHHDLLFSSTEAVELQSRLLAHDAAFLQEAHTAGDTLTANETAHLHTNEGAGGDIEIVLPAAAANVGPFTFYVQAAHYLKLTAGAGDTIRVLASESAAAGYVRAQTVGNWITLRAINATEWVCLGSGGTWTVDS